MARTTRWYRRIAPFYDWVCRPLFARPRRDAVRLLQLRPGATVLDLGCGTGLSLPLLAAAVGPGGRVLGLDATDAMLRRAERRCESHRLAQVQLHHGDLLDPRIVAALPPVDAILCSYVLAITPQWRELYAAARALLPVDGRLVVVDTRPLQGGWRWLNPLLVPVADWSGAGEMRRPTWQLERLQEQRSYWGGFVFVATNPPPA
jgi:ubiquinone/menaquinone biosynthesis C-methylase UbiE